MNPYQTPVTINQNKKGYRHSTEPFLIADFLKKITKDDKPVKNMADLGTGSGAISILLGRYFPNASITAIEIQPELATLAKKNISGNGLRNIKLILADIKHLPFPQSLLPFDSVISNPPFIKASNGRLSPDVNKSIATHEIKITLDELLKSSKNILKPYGRIILSYTPARLDELFHKMIQHSIKPRTVQFAHHNINSHAYAVLVEGVKTGKQNVTILPPVFIER